MQDGTGIRNMWKAAKEVRLPTSKRSCCSAEDAANWWLKYVKGNHITIIRYNIMCQSVVGHNNSLVFMAGYIIVSSSNVT